MAGEIENLPIRSLSSVVGVDKDGYAGKSLGQWRNVLNVKNFGAIGDGVSHPLSEVYATIADAKAVYPKAVALTETLDWHAHQKAIDTALALGGGIVYTPKGIYKMVGPTSLKFPLMSDRFSAPVSTSTTAQVNWLGDGDDNTVLHWDADKGTVANDNYAIMCGDAPGDPAGQQANTRYANNAQSAGWFMDLCLVGPARVLLPANTLGQAGCNMSGICWAARRELTRVRISHFYAGIDLVGDHTTFSTIKLFSNYYGIYFNHNSPSMYGDLTMGDKSMIENCRMACIGFAWGGVMNNWHVYGRSFMGQSPFVFFKEATPLDGSGNPIVPTGYTERGSFLAGVYFDTTFFEGVGNAIVWDNNITVNGASRATMDHCTFNQATFPGWNDSKKIATYDRCLINIGTINGGGIIEFSKMEPNGCTLPLINVTKELLGEFLIQGDIEAIITLCATANIALLGHPTTGSLDTRIRRFKFKHTYGDANCGPWSGKAHYAYNTSAVTKNNIVGHLFNGIKLIRESDRNTAFIGVARSSTPSSGGICIVAEEGEEIPVFTTAPATVQSLKKISSSNGVVTDASSLADGRVIGMSSSVAGRITLFKNQTIDLNARPRISENQGGTAYTVFIADWGKIKKLTTSGARATNAVVASGGTGYAVGDTITLTGGAFSAATVLTVSTVSSGAVTGVTITTPGVYTTIPTNPVAQGSTSGSGTGATFTMTYNLIPIVVTLPNNLPVGFEVELWQGSNSPVTWTTASGTTVVAAASLTQTNGLHTSIRLTVTANSSGTNAEWFIR